MRFVSEYRDPVAAQALTSAITELAGDDSFKFMEVCGGHTHTIYRHGIEHVLPPSIELVHGPGCPVCVIPMGRVDDAIAVAEQPGVTFTTFGDMMRVPGGNGTLLEAKARGADIRFVYSPMDALELAPGQLVTAGFGVFLGVLQAVAMLLTQIRDGRCEVENQYSRVVRDEGNPRALCRRDVAGVAIPLRVRVQRSEPPRRAPP